MTNIMTERNLLGIADLLAVFHTVPHTHSFNGSLLTGVKLKPN
jgi:hypothetical protein